jgi:hypothetical protein
MGICISAEYKDAPDFSMGYASFFRLRNEIAHVISEEFGDAYGDITWGSMHPKEYDERINYMIRKYHVKSRICSFLFASDCEGRLSPMKCKAVYDLIYDMKSTSEFGYVYSKMTMEQFKELLKECYERKRYLYWR